jgi:hypothetical protein
MSPNSKAAGVAPVVFANRDGGSVSCTGDLPLQVKYATEYAEKGSLRSERAKIEREVPLPCIRWDIGKSSEFLSG